MAIASHSCATRQQGVRRRRQDPKPQGGGSAEGGGGQASNSGEGMDDFVFEITQQEFLEFLFEDMELPNLTKRQLAGIEELNTGAGRLLASVGTPQ